MKDILGNIDLSKMMEDVKGLSNNTHVSFPLAGVQIKKEEILTAIQVIENDVKQVVITLTNGEKQVLKNMSFMEYMKEFNK